MHLFFARAHWKPENWKAREIQITTVIFHACISNFARFTPLEKPTSQVFFFDTL